MLSMMGLVAVSWVACGRLQYAGDDQHQLRWLVSVSPLYQCSAILCSAAACQQPHQLAPSYGGRALLVLATYQDIQGCRAKCSTLAMQAQFMRPVTARL